MSESIILQTEHLGILTPDGAALLSDVSLKVPKRQMVHLVGESGSGKSLTLKAVMGLVPSGFSVSGTMRLSGEPFAAGQVRGRRITMVFQDPGASFDPLYTVGFHIREVLVSVRGLSSDSARVETERLLEVVGLRPSDASLYPHEMSGGMKQRAAVALALAPEPELILLDEPTTALDPTVERRILSLIADLVEHVGVSVLLVTHDLSVVSRMGGLVAVMYGGMIMETGEVEEVLSAPEHPYTIALMEAAPFGGTVRPIPGDVLPPSLRTGCPFHNRCPEATDICHGTVPEVRRHAGGREVRCHLR